MPSIYGRFSEPERLPEELTNQYEFYKGETYIRTIVANKYSGKMNFHGEDEIEMFIDFIERII
jgi:hypothetical protein